MGLIKEFKEFAMRGNVIDLAVGVIIGAAFGAVVSSMVSDVLMPPIGWAAGNLDFSQMQVVLKHGTPDPKNPAVMVGEVAIRYGKFINTIINFLIVAVCIFLVVKAMNAMKKKEAATPPPPAPPTKDQILLTEIRDAILARR